jgi:hypothetical protein
MEWASISENHYQSNLIFVFPKRHIIGLPPRPTLCVCCCCCVQHPPQNGMGFDIRKTLSIQPDLRLSQAPHHRPAAAAHVVRLLLLLRKRNRLPRAACFPTRDSLWYALASEPPTNSHVRLARLQA